MYQPYPTSGPVPEQQRTPPPGSVLEVVAVVIALVSKGSLKSTILARHPAYTAAQLHTAEAARTVPLIIGGVIAAGLWIWMAWANRQGRGWARVVSAVLFGINTLDLIVAALVVRGAVASAVIGVVLWLVGLGVIVLIFNQRSSPFYRQPSA
jgi:hypothetical protein